MADAETSYLTPLSTVLFIFALCTAYMFLSMNGGEFTYVGDYKFILFKVMVTIATVAMGFVITVTSVAYYYVLGGMAGLGESMMSYDFTTNAVFTTFMLYLSSIWMALAVAMLPFGHTVYVANTDVVDMDRTYQLNAVQQAVYAGPYRALMIIMSLNLLVVLLMFACSSFNPLTFEPCQMEGFGALGKHLAQVFHGLRPTFGPYFRLDADKWRDVGKWMTNLSCASV